MKQNSQWLSQVRTASNNAECTSAPSGSPAALGTTRSKSSPPRRSSRHRSASSTSNRHWITSRGRSPSIVRISSPGCNPARAAGDADATATTVGTDMRTG